MAKPETFDPTAVTTPTPSPPGTAGNAEGPGSFPWIVPKSIGLTGAAKILIATSLSEGDLISTSGPCRMMCEIE